MEKLSRFMAKADIPKEFMLKYGDLKFGNKLGEGSFGIVYAGMLRERTPVAIKQFRVPFNALNDTEFNEMANEFVYLQKKSIKSHPSVVHLYGVTANADRIYVVTELCANGDLHKKTWYGRY
eukprot:GHVU01189601.1.p1 GENE.GHVU01189601.1~~GHVU01189601.1.p1  ORF type:complete len:122 (+),score=14.61 GHVU01189601.1:45-410(+)